MTFWKFTQATGGSEWLPPGRDGNWGTGKEEDCLPTCFSILGIVPHVNSNFSKKILKVI